MTRTGGARSLRWLALALCALGCVPLLWPGDAPFINDEPLLIQKALRHLQAGALAGSGIEGTKGVVYGPLAVWIYTLLLWLTKDLTVVVALRALLCTAATAWGLLLLCRFDRTLRPVLLALALLSPYLWFYSRLLWDNTFQIPLAVLALGAYASFCVRPAAWRLGLTLTCLCGMFLLHLMSLSLILPVLGHCLWFHRGWLRAHRRAVAGLILLCAGLVSPYLVALVRSALSASQKVADLAAGAGAAAGPPPPLLRWEGWVFPLFGGRLFSAQGLDYFFGPGWARGWPLRGLAAVTWLGLPLVWAGILLCAARVRRWHRAGRPRAVEGEVHLALLALGVLGCMVLQHGIMQAFGHPHYYSATWVCFFYFLWTALSAAGRGGLVLSGVYGVALAGVLGALIVTVHREGGNQGMHYGTTLQHQIEVVRALHRYHPDAPVRTTVSNFVQFPHGLKVLREVYGLNGRMDGPRRRLLVRHRDQRTGWLVIEEEGE
jgi:hypothetical protein